MLRDSDDCGLEVPIRRGHSDVFDFERLIRRRTGSLHAEDFRSILQPWHGLLLQSPALGRFARHVLRAGGGDLMFLSMLMLLRRRSALVRLAPYVTARVAPTRRSGVTFDPVRRSGRQPLTINTGV